jgi:hypothetical protein
MYLFFILMLASQCALADEQWRPPNGTAEDRTKAVIEHMKALNIDEMTPIEIEKFQVPPASIHVMRVKLEESYTIDGIGSEKVDLKGWIAVVQYAPKPIDATKPLSWENSLVETQFVALDLKGQSNMFGRMQLNLDPQSHAKGHVGTNVEIPEAALFALANIPGSIGINPFAVANQQGDDKDKRKTGEKTADEKKQLELKTQEIKQRIKALNAAKCRAEVAVQVKAPELGLDMKTKSPVTWFSVVDSIPPVGLTASVVLTPTELISGERKVGTLVSGKINFRELVLSVPLEEAWAISFQPKVRNTSFSVLAK